MNKVVICTLSFNRQPYTKRFVETLFNGTSEPFDLVIVDQGSAEPANKLCKYLDGKKTENGSTIKVIWNASNVGIPKGLNQGISLRDPSQHFMKIDNDVIMPNNYKEWITHLVDIVEHLPDKDPVKILGLSPFDPNRPLSERGTLRDIVLTNGHRYPIEWWPHNLLEMGLFISRDVINKIGGFNERGLMYGYEGPWFQAKAACSRAYFYTCEAKHGDAMDLLESQPHRAKKDELLKGGQNGVYASQQYSEDTNEVNVKFI